MRPEVILPPAADYALRIRHTIRSGWEQWYLLTGDAHWDAPECYLGLLHRHLREAKERTALIIDNGDWFDAISSRDDKRGSKGTLREEHSGVNYLDRLVSAALDEFSPYLNQFVYMGTGNHETSILIRKETDITQRFIDAANALRKGMPPIHRAGFTGWIRLMFEQANKSGRFSHSMKIEHGAGGNAPVTKGTIQTNRRQVRTEGATFFVTGHIHEQWQFPRIVERLNESSSKVEQRRIEHVQVSSYKRDFRTDGAATWATMNGFDPKPIGGMWLRLHSPNGHDVEWEVKPTWVDYATLDKYLPRTKVEPVAAIA